MPATSPRERHPHTDSSLHVAPVEEGYHPHEPSETETTSAMPESGATPSIWTVGVPPLLTRPLDADVETDVCVVGAGVAGLTTALMLAQAGKRVTVLDDGAVGDGMSGRGTAHLRSALEEGYHELERLHGPDGARLAASSHTHAIDRIEDIVRTERIECDFERVDGFRFMPPQRGAEALMRECDAAVRAGLIDTALVEHAPFAGFDSGTALRFPHQAMLHPMKYLAGLVRACQQHGVRLFTCTRALTFAPAAVRTREGPTVHCTDLVVATHSPVNDRFGIHSRQHAFITYVVGALVPRGSVPHVLAWEAGRPSHALRVVPKRDEGEQPPWDVLLVSGEDHRTGQADDGPLRWARLEAWIRERFPDAGEVMYRWSGQVLRSIDGLAHIGRVASNSEHVYIITGDSGGGLTHATLGAIIISDTIIGLHSPWTTLYSPSRLPLRATGEWAREGVNMAVQYGDWVTRGDVASIDEIAPGDGAVVRQGLSKIAAWRRPDGTLVEHSAMCPHAGCLVHWNSSETTWDCPCHGSRFTAEGHVFEGPANRDLAKIEARTSTEPPS